MQEHLSLTMDRSQNANFNKLVMGTKRTVAFLSVWKTSWSTGQHVPVLHSSGYQFTFFVGMRTLVGCCQQSLSLADCKDVCEPPWSAESWVYVLLSPQYLQWDEKRPQHVFQKLRVLGEAEICIPQFSKSLCPNDIKTGVKTAE